MYGFAKRKDIMTQEQSFLSGMGISHEVQKTPNNIMVKKGEHREKLNPDLLDQTLMWARTGYEEDTDLQLLREETIRNCFDGMTEDDISKSLILASVAFINEIRPMDMLRHAYYLSYF